MANKIMRLYLQGNAYTLGKGARVRSTKEGETLPEPTEAILLTADALLYGDYVAGDSGGNLFVQEE